MILDIEFKKEQDYHDYLAIRQSTLANFVTDKSKLVKNKKKEVKYFDFGTYFEADVKDAVYGTTTCISDFYVVTAIPDRRSKKGKEAYQEIVLEAEGKTIMTKDDVYLSAQMRDNLLEMPIKDLNMTVAQIVEQSTSGRTIVWETKTPEGEVVRKKCMIDFELNTKDKVYNFDLKSTRESVYYFYKSIKSFRYDIQDVLYSEGSRELHKKPVQNMIFLASSKKDKMCRPWVVDLEDRHQTSIEIPRIIQDYNKWVLQGMPIKGYVADIGVAKIY